MNNDSRTVAQDRSLTHAVKRKALSAFCSLCVVVAVLQLQFASAADRSTEIRERLQQRFPNIRIEAVMPAPWAGLYEVFTSNELVYSTESGDRLFVGKMVDTKTGKDLTAERWSDYNKIDFDSLPFESAITIVRGDGSRKLAIFEDPFCPYCEELEKELKDITDITIYVFLYPLENLHPGAGEAARDIWCASDPASAWTTWMQSQQAPPEKRCQTPIAAVAKLGDRLRVNSTPTLFFVNGRRVSGSIESEQLEKLFLRASDERQKLAQDSVIRGR